jgi:hypothetical protein
MTERRRQAIALGIVLAAISLIAFRVSGSMADFDVYWRGAARAAAAEPLYRAEDGHFQFKYLPAFAVLTIPLSFMPLTIAKAVWFITSVAFLFLLVWIGLELLPERRKSPTLLVAAVVVVLAKFFARELVLGQVNLLFAVLAASAFLAMKTAREALAGVLLGVTIAIKPYGLLFVPWLIARRRTSSIVAVCATALAIGLLPVARYGVQGTIALHRAWWNTVTDTTPANLLNPDNVSFASMWVKWVGPGPLATSLAAATAVCALLAFVTLFRRRHGAAFPEALEGSLLLMLVPLLSPQGWDYVLLLSAPAVILLANYEDRLPAALRAAAIAAALIMGLSLFDVMGRRAYGVFMGWAVISVCASVLITALCVMRFRRIA